MYLLPCPLDAAPQVFELTQAQNAQIQKVRNTKAFTKISTWLHLPCPIVLLEMTLRHQSLLAKRATNVVFTINSAMFNLAQQHLHDPFPSSCGLDISCFASIHKLLLLSLATMHLMQPDRASGRGGHPTLNQVTETHIKMQSLLKEIQTRHPGAGTPYRYPASPTQQATQQLRAMIVMVLTWLGSCLRRVMLAQDGYAVASSDTGKLLDWLPQLEVHDPELTELALQLALPTDPHHWGTCAVEFRHECALWDEYACKHLHGRLLPGCSYLRCTEIGGTSEASLPTLLCSGCRRTRYCSVRCQKAAWVQGGHSDVCGRGMWAATQGSQVT